MPSTTTRSDLFCFNPAFLVENSFNIDGTVFDRIRRRSAIVVYIPALSVISSFSVLILS